MIVFVNKNERNFTMEDMYQKDIQQYIENYLELIDPQSKGYDPDMYSFKDTITGVSVQVQCDHSDKIIAPIMSVGLAPGASFNIIKRLEEAYH